MDSPSSAMLSRLFTLLLLLVLILAVALLETAQIKFTVLGWVAFICTLRFPFFTHHARRIRWACAAVAVLSAGIVWWLMPPRLADPGARIQSVVLDDHGRRVPLPLLPWLANLVPEADAVKVSLLFKDVFPFPTGGVILQELREQSPFTSPLRREYATLREKDLHRHLSSVLFFQLMQDLGFYRGLHHFFLVVPRNARQPVPVIVFLHGYLGNLQCYSSFLSDLEGFALLLPSTPGLSGIWTARDLSWITGQDMDQLAKVVPVSKQHIHLVGLSNGGSGVNHALQVGLPFQSFTFISTSVRAVPSGFDRHTPLGFIWGERDSMAPRNRQSVADLRRRELNVTALPFVNERHFVMLTRRQEVLDGLRSITRDPP